MRGRDMRAGIEHARHRADRVGIFAECGCRGEAMMGDRCEAAITPRAEPQLLDRLLAAADQRIGALQQFRADLQARIERFERWLEEREQC